MSHDFLTLSQAGALADHLHQYNGVRVDSILAVTPRHMDYEKSDGPWTIEVWTEDDDKFHKLLTYHDIEMLKAAYNLPANPTAPRFRHEVAPYTIVENRSENDDSTE